MSLDEYRKKINEIDEEIIRLINERASHVIEIGNIKREKGESVYRPDREQEIFERITKMSEGKVFPASAMRAVFREIISASRTMEEPLSVAFFGAMASYTHISAIEQFGTSTNFVPLKTIADVFKEVEVGKYRYGVVPIENSTEGAVNYTLDLFISSSLKITSENYISIHHNLLSSCEDISEIKRVYSHPQALAQCRIWLMNNLPHAELHETSSTSEACKVIGWDKHSASIASSVAAKLYNLNIIEESIEDNPENYTRFLVIGKEDCEEMSGNDKTSLVITVKDEAGSLYKVLSIINDYGVNMSKIESRPAKKRVWDYVFYIDMDGHRKDAKVAELLKKLEEHSTFLKVLGSYPKKKIFTE